MNAPKSLSSKVVIVGNEFITEGDIIKELKARAGKRVISDMVMASAYRQYAQEKGVTVNDSDVEQLYRFSSEQYLINNGMTTGKTLEETLKDEGIPLEDYKNDLRTIALQIKMVVTDDEMKKAVDDLIKSKQAPYTMPKHYRIRQLVFPNKTIAVNQVEEMRDGSTHGLVTALGFALNQRTGFRPIIYAPGVVQAKANPQLDQVLRDMRKGDISKPFQLNGTTYFAVVQVLDVFTPIIPTYKDSNLIAGQYLMQADVINYGKRKSDLEAQVLQKTPPQFLSSDYNDLNNYFKELKSESPEDVEPSTTPMGVR